MASNSGYRFIAALLLLYLAATALFLLFIQHSSSRHLAASHGPAPRSPLVMRSATAPAAPRPLVLFWTPLWDRFDNWARLFSVPRLRECRFRCSFSSQEQRLDEAALVLFSLADLHRMPPPGVDERPANQLWALLALDPPVAARRRAPELRRYDRVFNWTVSYRRDSDVPLTYGRVVARPRFRQRPVTAAASAARRAVFRPQLCTTSSRREQYVRELRRHMDVDVLGPCANVSCGSAAQCFARFRGNYTFYLALEAAHCVDFVSSPLHQALRHGMVPVVRGAAEYRHLTPPHSFIDAAAFSGPEALARHLTGLSNEQLNAYRRWQGTHEVVPADWACEVCTRLHRLGTNSSAFPAHGGDQLHRWWYERGRCEPASAGGAAAPAA